MVGSPLVLLVLVGLVAVVTALLRVFVRDQLVEPAHLALAGVEAELVQLAGVAVDLLAGPGQRGAQALPALLDGAPAALQDAHPDLGRGAGEERQVHAEAVVVPGLRAGLGEQLGEPLLALGGDPVDPPGPPGPAGRSGSAGCSSTISPARSSRRRAGYSEP